MDFVSSIFDCKLPSEFLKFFLDEVICVIIIEYSEQQKEFFEKEYNKKAAGILIGQIDSLKDRVTEYINDGIIIFNTSISDL